MASVKLRQAFVVRSNNCLIDKYLTSYCKSAFLKSAVAVIPMVVSLLVESLIISNSYSLHTMLRQCMGVILIISLVRCRNVFLVSILLQKVNALCRC